MKKIIASAAMLFTLSTTAQTTTKIIPDSVTYTHVSRMSNNKDTLYLMNNDIGKMIQQIWADQSYVDKHRGKKPMIVMVDPKNMHKYIGPVNY